MSAAAAARARSRCRTSTSRATGAAGRVRSRPAAVRTAHERQHENLGGTRREEEDEASGRRGTREGLQRPRRRELDRLIVRTAGAGGRLPARTRTTRDLEDDREEQDERAGGSRSEQLHRSDHRGDRDLGPLIAHVEVEEDDDEDQDERAGRGRPRGNVPGVHHLHRSRVGPARARDGPLPGGRLSSRRTPPASTPRGPRPAGRYNGRPS